MPTTILTVSWRWFQTWDRLDEHEPWTLLLLFASKSSMFFKGINFNNKCLTLYSPVQVPIVEYNNCTLCYLSDPDLLQSCATGKSVWPFTRTVKASGPWVPGCGRMNATPPDRSAPWQFFLSCSTIGNVHLQAWSSDMVKLQPGRKKKACMKNTNLNLQNFQSSVREHLSDDVVLFCTSESDSHLYSILYLTTASINPTV